MAQDERTNILKIWRADIFAEFSISEIMKLSKKRTKTWIFNTLKFLAEHEILSLKKKGNINIYSLKTSNPVSLQLLQYLEAQENIYFPQMNIISEIIDRVPVKIFSLIVFGSYATKTQKKQSDLDICLLVEDKKTEKRMRPYVNEVKLSTATNIDEHYVTFEDFVKMLLQEDENLGKQIFRSHRLFYNAEIYYQLVKEAHRNGFRP